MISTLLMAVIIFIILSTAVSLATAGVGEFTSLSLRGGSNAILVALASIVAIAGAHNHSAWVVAASKQGLDQGKASTKPDLLLQTSQGTFSTGVLQSDPSISGVGYAVEQREIAAFNIDKLTFSPFSAICIQWQSNPTWADIIYQTNRRIAAMVQHPMLNFPYYLFLSKDIKVFPSSKRRVSNDS